MALTEFGKAVRKARLDVGENISSMASELHLSAAFLSGIETGRKKIPGAVVAAIQNFFVQRGLVVDQLPEMADVANKTVSLEGLAPQQQMLIAGFARTSLDAEMLENMAKLLATANKKGS